ncbi:MAG: hypothetical protein RIR10_1361, partial [Planctomycetota bacterium]
IASSIRGLGEALVIAVVIALLARLHAGKPERAELSPTLAITSLETLRRSLLA